MWDFPGGVHPPERKSMSITDSVDTLPLTDYYYVPLKQHIGVYSELRVKVGDKVKKGQALTFSNHNMAVPVHAPTSGEIIEIGEHVSSHASGIPEKTVTIKSDGLDESIELQPQSHFHTQSKESIIKALQEAGITGLGGAGFPTHVKQQAQDIEYLLINGVECEPYITADDMLMRNYADEIVHGIEVLAHLLEPKLVVIAIEDNKPEAIAALDEACKDKQQFIVRKIPTKYPAGGEKQLIQVLTGKQVPKGSPPAALGIVSQNVGTCYAIYKAIYTGEPLIERIVTITGENLDKPQNVWARIGTPVEHLLNTAGYHPEDINAQKLVMGGPMMGFNLHSAQVPVTKSTNCIIAPTQQELPPAPPEKACIRCSDCADACPASLLPQQLYWHSSAKEYDKAQDLNLFDCIECGACAFVCPSDIPLVQYYRQAKAEIRQAEVEQEKAEQAKKRFEARAERLEKEKEARLAKHKKAAENRKKAMQSDPSAQDKVAAALARVQAKKAEQTENNTDSAQSTVKSKAEQAIELAKAKRLAKQGETKTSEEFSNTNDNENASDNKSKAQAAIERAKAKRLAKQAAQAQAENTEADANITGAQNTTDAQSDTKADTKSVAKAAIERAKAKRLAKQAAQTQAENTEADANTTGAQNTTDAQPDTKSVAQAAIERAKAKRLAKQNAQAQAENTEADANTTGAQNTTDAQSDTKADTKSVAKAAIERAKAKPLAKEAQQIQTEHDEANASEPKLEENNDKSLQAASSASDTKAKAQAAIAKAKARRQQSDDNAEMNNATQATHEHVDISSDNKAKARAAIERAKARRQQAEQQTNEAASVEENDHDSEQKVRIKAAIAKAKAKREQGQ
nr:electron transport complex subunit RsxC [Marinifaba aquimaris]